MGFWYVYALKQENLVGCWLWIQNFICESETGFALSTNADTNIIWIGVKRRFRLEDNGVIRASWEDDEDWIEIHSEREWKKMVDRAYEISVLENNESLPRRLVIVVPKNKDIVSRLEM